MTRLTSSFWVQAYIKKLNLMGVPAFVVSHGDNTAGAIVVKVNKLNGVTFDEIISKFNLNSKFVTNYKYSNNSNEIELNENE